MGKGIRIFTKPEDISFLLSFSPESGGKNPYYTSYSVVPSTFSPGF
jgi:hypothetical protein